MRQGSLIALFLLVACSKPSGPAPSGSPPPPPPDVALAPKPPTPPDAPSAPSAPKPPELTITDVHITADEAVGEGSSGTVVTLHATVTPHLDLGVKRLVELTVVCQLASGGVIDGSAGIAAGKVGEARPTSFTFFDEGPLEAPPTRCDGRVGVTAPDPATTPSTELARVCWTAGKEAPGACSPPLH